MLHTDVWVEDLSGRVHNGQNRFKRFEIVAIRIILRMVYLELFISFENQSQQTKAGKKTVQFEYF